MSGIVVGFIGGTGALYNQIVTGEVWIYRWNNSIRDWVLQNQTAYQAITPEFNTEHPAQLSAVVHFPNSAGYYRVVMKLTWWLKLTPWTKAGYTNVWFDSTRDYAGTTGAAPGPGYCTIY